MASQPSSGPTKTSPFTAVEKTETETETETTVDLAAFTAHDLAYFNSAERIHHRKMMGIPEGGARFLHDCEQQTSPHLLSNHTFPFPILGTLTLPRYLDTYLPSTL